MLLPRFLNKALGAIGGGIFYSAKSLLTNLAIFAVGLGLVAPLLAIAFIFISPFILGPKFANDFLKKSGLGWPILLGIGTFFVMLIAVPVAIVGAAAFLFVLTFHDLVKSFYRGVVEGYNQGFFNHVLIKTFTEHPRNSSTVLSKLLPKKDNDDNEPDYSSPSEHTTRANDEFELEESHRTSLNPLNRSENDNVESSNPKPKEHFTKLHSTGQETTSPAAAYISYGYGTFPEAK